MDWEPHEIFVTAITAAGFIGLAVWALLYGIKLRWPKGVRRTLGGPSVRLTVHVIADDSVSETAASRCEWAALCARKAWIMGGYGEAPFEEVCVHFVPVHHFNRSPWLVTVSSYLSTVGRVLGTGIPRLVIRYPLIDEVVKTGEPVIHEMMHALSVQYSSRGKDRDHPDPGIWMDTDGSWGDAKVPEGPSVQERARWLFQQGLP